MIRFHVPPFTIDSGNLVVGEAEITADKIENTRAAIFACEDLLKQKEGTGDGFCLLRDRVFA